MVQFVMFLLAAFGLTACFTVTREKFKILNFKPFNCPLCMSFWIAFAMAWFCDYHPVLFWAGAAAGFTWILYKYVTGEY